MSPFPLPFRSLLPAFFLWFFSCLSVAKAEEAPPVTLRVQAVESLKKLPSAAAPKLAGQGIKLKVAEGGGTAEAVVALGSEAADVALTVRPISGEEVASFPDKAFEEVEIGKQVVALLVPDILWQNAIRALTREEAKRIYESKLINWSELGGPDRTIKFFNPVRGQGVWEMFATWLYGDQMKAGPGRFDTVENGENASATVQFNSGALAVANLRWVDGKEVHALAIKDEEGIPREPTNENIVSGKYPLSRPIYVLMAARQLGVRRRFVEFLKGPDGREILKKNEIVPIDDLIEKGGSGK